MLIQITQNDLQIPKLQGRLTAVESAVRRAGLKGARCTCEYIYYDFHCWSFPENVKDWMYNYSKGNNESEELSFEIDYILPITE